MAIRAKEKFLASNTLNHARRLFGFLQLGGISPRALVLPVCLSCVYTLLAFLSIRILLALARGIVGNDFRGVMGELGLGMLPGSAAHLSLGSVQTFVVLVLFFYAVTLLKNICFFWSSRSIDVPVMSASVRIRQILVGRLLGFGKGFYDKNTVSYLQSVLTKSTVVIQSQFRLFHAFLTSLLLFGAFLFIMFRISPLLTVLSAIVLPFVVVLTRKLVDRLRAASTEHNQAAMNLGDRVFDLIYCMPVIKTFTREKEELRLFSDVSGQELKHSLKVQSLRGLMEPIEDIAATTAILLIAFGMAALMSCERGTDAAQIIVFFYLIMQLKNKIRAFDNFRFGAAGAVSAIEDIEKILDKDETWAVPNGQKSFAGLATGIEFRGLSFRYAEDGPWVLDNVSFSIEPRSRVAIVGASGSGKSTLISLLLRFYDCSPGMIWLNGDDIRSFDIESLRRGMSFVGQDVLLFNDTIRNNLTYGLGEEVPADVLSELVKKVHLEDVINKMPRKYDTVIGDRGGRLSGGERQRISIARTLMKDSGILILDEATSALDSQTEARIMDHILSAGKEKTIIMIAHRLSTIKRADKIVYLEKGRVAEIGTLPELLARKGAFCRQWEAQKL